ncbi:MAG: sodium:solute symporter family protein [Vicinamibacterales bacterium]
MAGPLDLVIVAAFVLYSVRAGFAARRAAARGAEDYFLAGRSVPGWKAGLSMTATQYAADTPLVVTGLIATAGVFALWRFWVYSVAFLLMGFLLAPAWRRAGVLTDAELCERRYSGRVAEVLRYVKAFYFGTFFNCIVLAFVLLAATRITEPFLPWHAWLGPDVLAPLAWLAEWVGRPLTAVDPASPDVWLRSASNLLSIGLIVGFTVLYSATGGLRGVIETDVVQVVLAFAATGIYAAVVVRAVGGLGQIPVRLTELYGAERMTAILSFNPVAGAGELAATVVALLGLQWLAQVNSDGTGYLAQRTMACRTDGDARAAAVVFTYAQSLVRTLLWLPIVVGLLVLYPLEGPVTTEAGTAAREGVFVTGVADHLSTGTLGLMLVGLLAALASTVDTHLNWGASYWTNDLYGRLYCRRLRGREASPRRLVWVARGASVLILLLALAVMSQLGSLQTAWKTSLLFGAGMGVPQVLRWVWHRQNAWGEMVPLVLSLAVAPLLLVLLPADHQDAMRLVVMTLVATAASIGASLATAPVEPAHLDRFFVAADPPGFWSVVARRTGRDGARNRRRLWRALAATAFAAGSVFALIVGLGTWLLHAPGPKAVSRPLWIGGLVAAGLALVPAWWHLARHDGDD